MMVPGFGRQEAGEPVEAPVDEVEVEMVGQGAPPIGASRRVEEFGDVGDVVGAHLTLDLETSHGSRVPVEPLPPEHAGV